MMSEKRFRANFDVSIYDSEKEEYISVSGRGLEEIAKRMNEQQDIIEAKDSLLSVLSKENEQLRQQLKEKEEDERLYANEILELRKTNEEWLQFKDLGGDY